MTTDQLDLMTAQEVAQLFLPQRAAHHSTGHAQGFAGRETRASLAIQPRGHAGVVSLEIQPGGVSMDACDYCHRFEAVTWDEEAGDICATCLKAREDAKERERDEQEAIELEERSRG